MEEGDTADDEGVYDAAMGVVVDVGVSVDVDVPFNVGIVFGSGVVVGVDGGVDVDDVGVSRPSSSLPFNESGTGFCGAAPTPSPTRHVGEVSALEEPLDELSTVALYTIGSLKSGSAPTLESFTSRGVPSFPLAKSGLQKRGAITVR